MPPTRPSVSRPRVRPSGADAARVRRLAARRALRAESEPELEAEPEATPPLEPSPAGKEGKGGRLHRPFGPMFWPSLLTTATLVLGGLAAWFGTQAAGVTGAPSAQNLALANTAETSQVTAQVTSAINVLFSYDYSAPDPTTKAASRLLTGAAVRQYAALFAQVKKDAPAQKLVVTTTVTSAGVELLTPDTARVLVFAAESDRKAGGTPATAGAMLAVNVVRSGSTWKISGIDTLG